MPDTNRVRSMVRETGVRRALLLGVASALTGLVGVAPALDAQENPRGSATARASAADKTDLCGGEKVEPLLSLSWLELDPEQSDSMALTIGRLTLQLANQGEIDLRLRVVADVRVDGQLLPHDVGTYILGPQARTSIAVPQFGEAQRSRSG